MNTVNFNTVIFKKIWVVLLFSFACSVLAAVLVYMLAPAQYKTTTSLFLSGKSPAQEKEATYWDMAADRSLAQNYAEIIKSEMYAGMVIKRLGLTGISPSELSGNITTGVVKESNVLEVNVIYKNKEDAKKIAQVFPLLLNDNQAALSSIKQVTVLNNPTEAKPLNSRKMLIVIASFFSGTLLALGFLFAVQRKNRIIRTHEDVEDCLGLKVAGIIPDYRI